MISLKLDLLLNYCMTQKYSYEKMIWLSGILGLKPPSKLKYEYYIHYYTALGEF